MELRRQSHPLAVAYFAGGGEFRARIRGDVVRVRGLFVYVKRVSSEDGGGTRVEREFEREAVHLTAPDGAYELVCGAPRTVDGDPRGFIRIYRGLLVGAGRLNNALLEASIRFTERQDGDLATELVDVRLV